MTIVAWDGEMIASDGLAVDNGIRVDQHCQKLSVVGNFCIGSAGCHWSAIAFREWWEEKQTKPDIPYPKLDDDLPRVSGVS
jgi:hypothetical protein